MPNNPDDFKSDGKNNANGKDDFIDSSFAVQFKPGDKTESVADKLKETKDNIDRKINTTRSSFQFNSDNDSFMDEFDKFEYDSSITAFKPYKAPEEPVKPKTEEPKPVFSSTEPAFPKDGGTFDRPAPSPKAPEAPKEALPKFNDQDAGIKKPMTAPGSDKIFKSGNGLDYATSEHDKKTSPFVNAEKPEPPKPINVDIPVTGKPEVNTAAPGSAFAKQENAASANKPAGQPTVYRPYPSSSKTDAFNTPAQAAQASEKEADAAGVFVKTDAVKPVPPVNPAANVIPEKREDLAKSVNTAEAHAAPAAPTRPAAQTAPAAPARPAAQTAPAAPARPAAQTAPAAPARPAAQTAPAAPARPAAQTAPAASSRPAAQTAPAAPSRPAAQTAPVAPSRPAAQPAPAAPSRPAAQPAPAAPSRPAAQTAPAAPSRPAATSKPAEPAKQQDTHKSNTAAVAASAATVAAASAASATATPSRPAAQTAPAAPSRPAASAAPKTNDAPKPAPAPAPGPAQAPAAPAKTEAPAEHGHRPGAVQNQNAPLNPPSSPFEPRGKQPVAATRGVMNANANAAANANANPAAGTHHDNKTISPVTTVNKKKKKKDPKATKDPGLAGLITFLAIIIVAIGILWALDNTGIIKSLLGKKPIETLVTVATEATVESSKEEADQTTVTEETTVATTAETTTEATTETTTEATTEATTEETTEATTEETTEATTEETTTEETTKQTTSKDNSEGVCVTSFSTDITNFATTAGGYKFDIVLTNKSNKVASLTKSLKGLDIRLFADATITDVTADGMTFTGDGESYRGVPEAITIQPRETYTISVTVSTSSNVSLYGYNYAFFDWNK